eukprot:jgi/Mesen1/10313/ME000079S09732
MEEPKVPLDVRTRPEGVEGDVTKTICRVCQKQFSKYSCPRCNLRYCSLPCYKAHSRRCTDAFHSDAIAQELHGRRASPEDSMRMVQALQRLHASDQEPTPSEDDVDQGSDEEGKSYEPAGCWGEDGVLSEDTLRQLAQGNASMAWDDLSKEEQREFQRAVAAGEVSRLMRAWDPWWLQPTAGGTPLTAFGTAAITPVTRSLSSAPTHAGADAQEGEGDAEVSSSGLPEPPRDPLPALADLTSAPPSALLPVHLVDILYAYCFTLRYYNGEWASEPSEAAQALLALSPVLAQRGAPESIAHAVAAGMETVCGAAWRHAGGPAFAVALVADVVALVALGRPAVLPALADAHRLLEAALCEEEDALAHSTKASAVEQISRSSESKAFDAGPGKQARVKLSADSDAARPGATGKARASSRQVATKEKQAMRRLELAARKLVFFMAWANEQEAAVYAACAALVGAQHEAEQQRLQSRAAGEALRDEAKAAIMHSESSEEAKKAGPRDLIQDVTNDDDNAARLS